MADQVEYDRLKHDLHVRGMGDWGPDGFFRLTAKGVAYYQEKIRQQVMRGFKVKVDLDDG